MTNKQELNISDITGVILAGGQAKRMAGQDKGLLNVNGRAMIEIIIERLSPQVNRLIINANRNVEQYRKFNYPVISDDDSTGFHGPLAGMLSALKTSTTQYILSAPCDSPFIPANLSTRLLSALIGADADICVVHDGNRMQPVFALIKKELHGSLQSFLNNGDRKIDLWYKQHHTVLVDFSDCDDISLNINTPDELQKLEQKLTEYKKVC
ncbi:MAG: molybdenum cofactor guanylyltransferase [Gammaproteobacteria bacterium]|nr:molybdenum cofactor guanylyltransferase [Gammaproteobacteria bacterium]